MVTGAFGYTGRHIARRLLDAGRRVRTLTGHPDRPDPFGGRVDVRRLEFGRPDELRQALDGADTLYNTYWVRFAHGGVDHRRAVEHIRVLLQAARAAGVRRVVHISITGADRDSPLPYFHGKALAEEAVRETFEDWAIVRPALVFGGEDVLIANIAWLLRRLPVFPLFGDGRYPVQPVHVEDLAALAISAGSEGGCVVRDAVGPETFTYREMVGILAGALRRHPAFLPMPPALAWALGLPLGLAVRDVVVTRDEIAGLMGGLLVSAGAPTASTCFTRWVREHAESLGRRWASELDRHYR